MVSRHERRAEVFVLVSSVIEGSFPIVINHAVRVFPALFFAGTCGVIGASIHLVLLLLRGKFVWRAPLRVWGYVAGVTLCNSVIALLLIFLGTRMTSGINTALLLQSEMLFSFLIFTVLFGEKVTRRQAIGAASVFFGTVLVLFNGSLTLNAGDLLIVLATAFYPFGNRCAQEALRFLPSGVVIFVRNAVGGVTFLVLSRIFEGTGAAHFPLLAEQWWLVALYGVVVLVVSKLCWYEGLKTLPLSRAVSIILSYPAFSLLFATLFLREMPSAYQMAGFFITFAGLTFLISKRSVPSPPPDLV